MFHLLCAYKMFSKVRVHVAEWPPVQKELLIWLTKCSLFIYYVFICNFGCFPFWFRGRDFGSDCISSWSILIFHLWISQVLKSGHNLRPEQYCHIFS